MNTTLAFKVRNWGLAVTVACAMAACGKGTLGSSSTGAGPADPVFTDAAPSVDALTADSSGTAPTRDDGGPARDASTNASVSEGPLDGELADLNTQIKALVAPIEAAIKSIDPVTKTPSKHVWVIDTKQGVTIRFTEVRAAGKFGWLGEAKKTADDDSTYVKCLAGALARDPTIAAHGRGAGILGVDLDKFETVTAGTQLAGTAQGQILLTFQHGPVGAQHRFLLKNYTADPAKAPAATVAFQAVRRYADTAANIPAMVWASAGGKAELTNLLQDVGVTATQDENFFVRLRRLVGVGGYAHAMVFGGDVAANTAYFVRECWNAQEQVAFRRIWQCTAQASATSATVDFSSACQIVQTTQFANIGGVPTVADAPSDPATPIVELCFPNVSALIKAEISADANASPPSSQSLTDGDAGVSATAQTGAPVQAAPPPAAMPAGDGTD